jgi:hypothetical protein
VREPCTLSRRSPANFARHSSRLRVISIQLQTRLGIAGLRGSVTIDARGSRIGVVNGTSQSLGYIALHVAPCVGKGVFDEKSLSI